MAKKSSSRRVTSDDFPLSPPGTPDPSVRDPFAAPAGTDLTHIAADLRHLAIRIDSLILDDVNIKDHGDVDLPKHAASLKEFGIRRVVIVRRSNRQIEAGNGCVLAAKLNGWEYVPVIFEDDDQLKARAFAAADNLVGTLAEFNGVNLSAIAAEVEQFYQSEELRAMTADIYSEMQRMEAELVVQEVEEVRSGGGEEQEINSGTMTAADVKVNYRVIVSCKDQEQQFALLAEMTNRGHECRLNTIQDRN